MAVFLPEPNKLCFLVWQTRVKNTIIEMMENAQIRAYACENRITGLRGSVGVQTVYVVRFVCTCMVTA